jgi:hypothetical protein
MWRVVTQVAGYNMWVNWWQVLGRELPAVLCKGPSGGSVSPAASLVLPRIAEWIVHVVLTAGHSGNCSTSSIVVQLIKGLRDSQSAKAMKLLCVLPVSWQPQQEIWTAASNAEVAESGCCASLLVQASRALSPRRYSKQG